MATGRLGELATLLERAIAASEMAGVLDLAIQLECMADLF